MSNQPDNDSDSEVQFNIKASRHSNERSDVDPDPNNFEHYDTENTQNNDRRSEDQNSENADLNTSRSKHSRNDMVDRTDEQIHPETTGNSVSNTLPGHNSTRNSRTSSPAPTYSRSRSSNHRNGSPNLSQLTSRNHRALTSDSINPNPNYSHDHYRPRNQNTDLHRDRLSPVTYRNSRSRYREDNFAPRTRSNHSPSPLRYDRSNHAYLRSLDQDHESNSVDQFHHSHSRRMHYPSHDRELSPIMNPRSRCNRVYQEFSPDPHRYRRKSSPWRSPHIPTIRPEPYDGSVCWEEYRSHFEDCAELSNWDNRSKVLYLATSLRSTARTFYMSLELDEKRSYRLLAARMQQRFGSSRHSTKWLSALENRHRQQGESITTLGDDIRQLTKKAYPHLDHLAQETLALNHLYKLISVEMKCRCIDKECSSIQQATEVIEKYEAILGDTTHDRRRGNIRAIETKNIEPNLSEILHKLDSRLERLENATNTRPLPAQPRYNKPRTQNQANGRKCCFLCNSPDHFFRNCPQKGQNMPSQRNATHNTDQKTPYSGNGHRSSL